ncbi:MAG: phosphotransferase [Muribaculaceae bacterium]|nr:phosphotransferase [Muribaculaceae bacterium]
MKLDIQGHSGCDIAIVHEDNDLFIHKSTHDAAYVPRLLNQAQKQITASKIEYQNIRVPKIFDVVKSEADATIKMEYIYSRNFIEHFEQAGFEQIKYLIGAIKYFIDLEIANSTMQTVPSHILTDKMADVARKVEKNVHLKDDDEAQRLVKLSSEVMDRVGDMVMPVGTCHGDLTFSNILFNGNNYYLIDFLDSFIESPLLDIVKIRQDTAYLWSTLMYNKPFDKVRLSIISEKIDTAIDEYFTAKYQWYRDYYMPLQLMNFLRILQYGHDDKVIAYLKRVISSQLATLNNPNND